MKDATWAIERVHDDADLTGIVEVEEASMRNPWTRDMYAAELRNAGVSRLYVLRDEAWPVAAFCAAWVIGDELHINNLAVRPECRRRGYARALLGRLWADAAADGAIRATLEVRRSNLAARQLYEGLGFRIAGVRKDYYSEPVEDALILWHDGVGKPA
jgi:[ribosomal protein S18]-alanine N-acetyltransferase